VQLVGYLESLTRTVIIDLVAVTAYEVGGSRVLVPQRVDPARRVAELSVAEAAARQANALQAGSGEFRAAAEAAPAEHRELARRLIDWAEELGRGGLVTLSTYRGKNDITTLLPRLRSDQAGLATVYLAPNGVYLQLWPTVFTRRAPDAVPVVERALNGQIKHGQRITAVSDDLLSALTSAYREAVGSTAA
jgi:hypothetical protein